MKRGVKEIPRPRRRVKRTPGSLLLGFDPATGEPIFMTSEQQAYHTHLVGASGSGKSKELESLCRQKIYDQAFTKRGMILLDPHGKLYDDLMRWTATHRLKRPIVPIDFRREEWVVAYNPLRHREGTDPSVVVDNLVNAMAHVWGQSNTDNWPLFARWAGSALHALYEKGHSLHEAIYLTDPNNADQRRRLTEGIENPLVASNLEYMNSLSPPQFVKEFSSTLNRLERFLRSESLRTIFGQTMDSLDLNRAIEEGHIILVNLSSAKSNLSDENARLYGTMLLSDLWAAARDRVKRDSLKPFYVFIDEFQRYLTPTIAENLDEARGFGLHMTLAHQFAGQLSKAGEIGDRIFGSIMNNAQNKIVFRLQHEPDLLPIAKWLAMGLMDPDQVKHEIHSTKVMGYKEEPRQSRSRGVSKTAGGGTGSGTATGAGTGLALGAGGNSYDSNGHLLGSFAPVGPAHSSNSFSTQNQMDNEFWATSESAAVQEYLAMIPQLGKEMSSRQYRPVDEQIFRVMQGLFGQKRREATVRLLDMKGPAHIETPFIKPGIANPDRVIRYADEQLKKWPFAISAAEAARRIEVRRKELQCATRTFEEPIDVFLECAERPSPYGVTYGVGVDGGRAGDGTIVDPSQSPMVSASESGVIHLEGLDLQPRDVEMLLSLFDSRFITIDQAARLYYGDNEPVAKRKLRNLCEIGKLLVRKEIKLSARGAASVIYGYAKPLFDLFRKRGVLPGVSERDWQRLRKRLEIGEIRLRHEIGIMDMKAAIVPAVSVRPDWRVLEFGVNPDRYRFQVSGEIYKPDGFFRLVHHQSPADEKGREGRFYLEFDRHGTSHKRLMAKIQAYRELSPPKGAPGHFRVMLVVLSKERMENVIADIAKLGVEKMVWMSLHHEVVNQPLAPIWTFPLAWKEAGGNLAKARRYGLLEDPAAKQSSGPPISGASPSPPVHPQPPVESPPPA